MEEKILKGEEKKGEMEKKRKKEERKKNWEVKG